MALIVWSDKLSVKIPSLDTQHKKLVDILNTLHDGIAKGKGKLAIGPVLSDLDKYIEEHFAYEEMLLKEHGFQDLDSHIAEHKELEERARELQKGIRTESLNITLDTMNFLKKWLSDHIVNSDMKYSRYLIERGVK